MLWLVISLVLLSIFSYLITKRDICSPSFIFSLSFLFSSLWGFFYADYWNLKLHINTYSVITGSVFLFTIVSFLVNVLMEKKTKEKMNFIKENKIIEIETWKKMILIFIELFTVIYGLSSVIKAVNGSFLNFSESIYNYRYLTTFTDFEVNIPILANLLITFSGGLSLWMGYVLVNNYLVTKKIDIILGIVYILSLLTSMICGARGGAVNIVLSTIVVLFVMLKKQKKLKILSFKFITKIFIVVIIILFSFQFIGNIMGRQSEEYSTFEYLAIYCGAEIKNLDLFLMEEHKSQFFGAQSLQAVIKKIGPKLDINTNYKVYSEFRSVNGKNLGNVYTTLMPYIYDGGIFGLIFFVSIMAIISQFIYEKSLRVRKDNIPSSYMILYGYIYTSLLMSFFANKFYNQIICAQLIYLLVTWLFLNIFTFKIKIKKY